MDFIQIFIDQQAFLTPQFLASVGITILLLMTIRQVGTEDEAPIGLQILVLAFLLDGLYPFFDQTHALFLNTEPSPSSQTLITLLAPQIFLRLGAAFVLFKAAMGLTGRKSSGVVVWFYLLIAGGLTYATLKIVPSEEMQTTITSIALQRVMPIAYLFLALSFWRKGKLFKHASGIKLIAVSFLVLAAGQFIFPPSWYPLPPTAALDYRTFWYILPAAKGLLVLSLLVFHINLLRRHIETQSGEINESRNRLRLIIQSSPFPIIISRLRDDRLMLLNTKAGELFNISVNSPGNIRMVDFFADPSDRQTLLTNLEKTPTVEDFEVLVRKPGKGDPFWLLISARVIDLDHEIALYCAFQDITGRKQKEIKLYDQATRDPLTNAYNRRQFEELAAKEVSRAKRYGGTFCLLMSDADFFKSINDIYGHSVGDDVLKILAACCEETLRDSDILARFGGEEFVILLPETSLENGLLVANRLREKMQKLSVTTDLGAIVRFTVSIGVAESSNSRDVDTLIKLADEALYYAKENGRNRVEYIRRPGEEGTHTVPPEELIGPMPPGRSREELENMTPEERERLARESMPELTDAPPPPPSDPDAMPPATVPEESKNLAPVTEEADAAPLEGPAPIETAPPEEIAVPIAESPATPPEAIMEEPPLPQEDIVEPEGAVSLQAEMETPPPVAPATPGGLAINLPDDIEEDNIPLDPIEDAAPVHNTAASIFDDDEDDESGFMPSPVVTAPPSAPALDEETPPPSGANEQETAEEPIEMAMPEEPVEMAMPEEPVEMAMPEEPVEMAMPEEPIEMAMPEEPVEMAMPEEPVEMAIPEEPVEMAMPEEPVSTEVPTKPILDIKLPDTPLPPQAPAPTPAPQPPAPPVAPAPTAAPQPPAPPKTPAPMAAPQPPAPPKAPAPMAAPQPPAPPSAPAPTAAPQPPAPPKAPAPAAAPRPPAPPKPDGS